MIALDLLSATEETRYEPIDHYTNFHYYHYYGSFTTLHDSFASYDPFFWRYETLTTYTVAVLAYRVEDGKLIWRAVSESFSPASAKAFSREIVRASRAALKKDGLIQP